MKKNRIFEIVTTLPERKINSKKFNEIFQVEGIPLWDMLETLITSRYLPRPFKNLPEIENAVKNKKFPSLSESFILFTLRKWLSINERLKHLISVNRKTMTGPKKRDILFLGFTNQVFEENGKFNFLGFGDVLRDLEKKKIKPLVLVCDLFANPFFKIRKYKNVPEYPASPHSYMDDEIIQKSKRLAWELNRKWKNIDKSKLFTFKGKNYLDFLKNEMNFIFSKELLFITLGHYLTFKKIIQMHDIKMVYVTGWGAHELALLAAARKLNKWAIYSPHGYGRASFKLIYPKDKYKDIKYGNIIFIATRETQKKVLSKVGIKKENIFVTGSPFFDKIVEYRPEKRKDETEKTVTFLTSALVEHKFIEKNDYFKYIKRYLAQLGKVKKVGKIVIKLNPNEKYKSEYESIVKTLKLENVEIVQRSEKEVLYSILRDSDLLISVWGSTADVEGMMLDKDVIVIDGLIKGPAAELVKNDRHRKAAVVIDKNDDLTCMVTKVLTNENLQRKLRQKRQEYVASSFYKIDGKAHQRIADLIYRYVKSHK